VGFAPAFSDKTDDRAGSHLDVDGSHCVTVKHAKGTSGGGAGSPSGNDEERPHNSPAPEPGRQGNIHQNTVSQGYQQNR